VSKIAATCLLGLGVIASSSLIANASDGVTPTESKTASSCLVPHGSGPGYSASIGNLQNGRTVCITIGERLLVLLSAGSKGASPWSQIRVSKSGILEIAPLTLMLARGTTGTNFQAERSGTVRLTSQRPACAPTTSAVATCDAIELWQANVVVHRSAPSPRMPPGTGVYGLVSAGPTCPVERAGQPCPPRPVAAAVDARDADGQIVASTRTDNAGRYALMLSPGTYTLVVDTGSSLPRCPSDSVVITAGPPLHSDISCDTGIR
jgi:hypothetical protein